MNPSLFIIGRTFRSFSGPNTRKTHRFSQKMGPLTRVLEHRLDTSCEAEFALPIVQIPSQTYARFPIFCNPSIGSLTTHGKHTGFFHHHPYRHCHHHEVFGEGDEA